MQRMHKPNIQPKINKPLQMHTTTPQDKKETQRLGKKLSIHAKETLMLKECPICGNKLIPIQEKKKLIGYFCDECGSYFDEKQKDCKVII